MSVPRAVPNKELREKCKIIYVPTHRTKKKIVSHHSTNISYID